MTPKEVINLAKTKEVKIVDLKLTDILGTWQHFALPVSELTEEVFAAGLGFDGSSIRGWRAINASDMLVSPDPATAFIDPFAANTTLSLPPATRMIPSPRSPTTGSARHRQEGGGAT